MSRNDTLVLTIFLVVSTTVLGLLIQWTFKIELLPALYRSRGGSPSPRRRRDRAGASRAARRRDGHGHCQKTHQRTVQDGCSSSKWYPGIPSLTSPFVLTRLDPPRLRSVPLALIFLPSVALSHRSSPAT